MKKTFSVLLLLLFCFGLNAQTKSSVEIVSFTIDTTMHYEVKYFGDRLDFQIEELNKGKWIAISHNSDASIEIIHDSENDKGFSFKNEFKTLISGRKYRLKITYPIALISKELEFKK
jgi:hypothetical protein